MWGLVKKALNGTVGVGMKTLDRISAEDAVDCYYNTLSALKTMIDNENVLIAPRVYSLDNSFIDNYQLVTHVAIPSDVKQLEESLFEDCQGLNDLYIPLVEYIGRSCFYLSGIESIVLGSSLKTIDDRAFSNCSYLTNIFYRGTKAQWRAIEKVGDWNTATPNYTIHCLDGDIEKGEDV